MNSSTRNSKLMIPQKKLYRLVDINYFLGILGINRLSSMPTSLVIIHFWKKQFSALIQPVDVWRHDTIELPDYDLMRFVFHDILSPTTGFAHFDMAYHFSEKKSKDLNTMMVRIDKVLAKRGALAEKGER